MVHVPAENMKDMAVATKEVMGAAMVKDLVVVPATEVDRALNWEDMAAVLVSEEDMVAVLVSEEDMEAVLVSEEVKVLNWEDTQVVGLNSLATQVDKEAMILEVAMEDSVAQDLAVAILDTARKSTKFPRSTITTSTT